MLTDEELEKYIDIHYREYGSVLSLQEANEQAEHMIRMIQLLNE